MKFKELKTFIHSSLMLVIGYDRIYPFDIDSTKYDNFEVIGIRASHKKEIVFDDYIIVSLKEPLFNTYVDMSQISRDNLEMMHECQDAKEMRDN